MRLTRLTPHSTPEQTRGTVVLVFGSGPHERLLGELAEMPRFCVQLSYTSYKEVPPPIIRSGAHIVTFGKSAANWVRLFVGAPPGQVTELPDARFITLQASRASKPTETFLDVLAKWSNPNEPEK